MFSDVNKPYHMRVSCLVEDFNLIEADVQESGMQLHISNGPRTAGGEKTYWSTDFSTPVIARSFFSSTVTFWSVRVLKTEKMS